MLRRGLFIVLLALLPVAVRAQPSVPPARTTPAEVAAAMLSCLGGESQATRMAATTDLARIYWGRGVELVLTRHDGSPRTLMWIALDNDPVRPPLVAEFWVDPADPEAIVSRQGFWATRDCFNAVYPPR